MIRLRRSEVAFIAKMCPPPAFVADRSARREACTRQFGRPWKEVSEEIRRRRSEYAQRDVAWLQAKLERKRRKLKEKATA